MRYGQHEATLILIRWAHLRGFGDIDRSSPYRVKLTKRWGGTGGVEPPVVLIQGTHHNPIVPKGAGGATPASFFSQWALSDPCLARAI